MGFLRDDRLDILRREGRGRFFNFSAEFLNGFLRGYFKDFFRCFLDFGLLNVSGFGFFCVIVFYGQWGGYFGYGLFVRKCRLGQD